MAPLNYQPDFKYRSSRSILSHLQNTGANIRIYLCFAGSRWLSPTAMRPSATAPCVA